MASVCAAFDLLSDKVVYRAKCDMKVVKWQQMNWISLSLMTGFTVKGCDIMYRGVLCQISVVFGRFTSWVDIR